MTITNAHPVKKTVKMEIDVNTKLSIVRSVHDNVSMENVQVQIYYNNNNNNNSSI